MSINVINIWSEKTHLDQSWIVATVNAENGMSNNK